MTAYTQDEINTLSNRLYDAFGAIIALDPGLISTPKAFVAGLRAIVSEMEAKKSLPLVQALLEVTENQPPPEEPPPTGDLESFFREFAETVRLLEQRSSPEEVQAFRSIAMAGAKAAAEASGGGFLGFGGEVSDQEREFLNRFERTFDTDSRAQSR